MLKIILQHGIEVTLLQEELVIDSKKQIVVFYYESDLLHFTKLMGAHMEMSFIHTVE
jgi:hypothetical protein